jgi:hypothetical protein
MRIKLRVSAQGTVVPVYTDLLVVARGPIEAVVGAISGPSAPVKAEEKRVLDLINSRLQLVNLQDPGAPPIV